MKILKWIFALLTLASTIVMLFIFPDTIPVHFDINGVADRWGSKFELLVVPIIATFIILLLECMAKYYTRKASESNDEKDSVSIISNVNVINITSIIMALVFFVLNILSLYTSYSQTYPDKNLPELDIIRVISIIMGLMFIVLGNYMPKTRNNRSIGFRLSWTQYNDTTWKKSNKFASYLMMIAGAITVISALFIEGIASTIIMLASLLISIVVMMIYAYIVYRDEKIEENN